MAERAVTFTSDGYTLAGTLTTPDATAAVPAVVMLPGSGQTDRDDNTSKLAINAFPPLVTALTAHGFATLRYDKRGVGASNGNYWRTGFHDHLADAVTAVNWLAAQPGVDPVGVFVLGHSEGALLATRLAAGAAPVAGAVLLAGSAKTGEQTLLWQGRQFAQTITGLNKWLIGVLHIDPAKQQQKYLDRIKASTTDTVRVQLVQKINARWMREFLTYDPTTDLAAVKVPILAITGAKDLQVDPADLAQMAELIPTPFEQHRLPDVTHLLRAEAGPASLSTYQKQAREPVDPRIVDLTTTWLQAQAHAIR